MTKDEFKEHPEVKAVCGEFQRVDSQQRQLEQQLLVTREPTIRDGILRQLFELNSILLGLVEKTHALTDKLGLE